MLTRYSIGRGRDKRGRGHSAFRRGRLSHTRSPSPVHQKARARSYSPGAKRREGYDRFVATLSRKVPVDGAGDNTDNRASDPTPTETQGAFLSASDPHGALSAQVGPKDVADDLHNKVRKTPDGNDDDDDGILPREIQQAHDDRNKGIREGMEPNKPKVQPAQT